MTEYPLGHKYDNILQTTIQGSPLLIGGKSTHWQLFHKCLNETSNNWT